jgi:hypothetical protein
MRRIFPVLMLVATLLTAGCGGQKVGGDDDATPSPVGKWDMDVDHWVRGMMKFTAKMPNAPKSEAELRSTVQNTWEFRADGTWTSTGKIFTQDIQETGKWILEDDMLTLEWRTRAGKPFAWLQTIEYDGKVLEFKPDKQAPFRLRLVRK